MQQMTMGLIKWDKENVLRAQKGAPVVARKLSQA